MKRERSRAYPSIDLKAACGLLHDQLADLGSQPLDRKNLAELLGYNASEGGMAARKIAALVHFGFFNRSDGRYALNARGFSLQQLARDSSEYKRVLRGALEQPVLFRNILDQFRPVGKVPHNLAPVLREKEYGITENASQEAAEIFWRSAVFAGILTREGFFIDPPSESQRSKAHSEDFASESESDNVQRIPILIPGWRPAYLVVPRDLGEDDLEILRQSFDQILQVLRLNAGVGLPTKARVVSIEERQGRRRE